MKILHSYIICVAKIPIHVIKIEVLNMYDTQVLIFLIIDVDNRHRMMWTNQLQAVL